MQELCSSASLYRAKSVVFELLFVYWTNFLLPRSMFGVRDVRFFILDSGIEVGLVVYGTKKNGLLEIFVLMSKRCDQNDSLGPKLGSELFLFSNFCFNFSKSRQ